MLESNLRTNTSGPVPLDLTARMIALRFAALALLLFIASKVIPPDDRVGSVVRSPDGAKRVPGTPLPYFSALHVGYIVISV